MVCALKPPLPTGSPDTVVDSHDPVFFIAVDPQGRRVATYRGTDTYPKETFVYHPDGVRGPHFQGGVMLRDRYSGLATTPSTWASAAGNATRDERMYYASDYRGNVIALVQSDSTIAEQYRYSSSGVPFGLPAGSIKGDGKVDGGTSGADYLIVNNLITHTLYEQRADLNLDGVVDSGDLAIVVAKNGLGTGKGSLSVAGVRNWKAFVGYEQATFGLNSIVWTRCVMVLTGLKLPLNNRVLARPSVFVAIGPNDDGYGPPPCGCIWPEECSDPGKPTSPIAPIVIVNPFDPPVPPPPYYQECKTACDSGSTGISICVDRNPVICVCRGNEVGGTVPIPFGLYDQFRECTKAHERIHISDMDCTKCTEHVCGAHLHNNNGIWTIPGGGECSEERAWNDTLTCASAMNCHGDADCQRDLDRFIEWVRGQYDAHRRMCYLFTHPRGEHRP